MLKSDWKYAKSQLHGTPQLPDTRIPGLAKPYSGGIGAHHAEKGLEICKITASRHHTASGHPYSRPGKAIFRRDQSPPCWKGTENLQNHIFTAPHSSQTPVFPALQKGIRTHADLRLDGHAGRALDFGCMVRKAAENLKYRSTQPFSTVILLILGHSQWPFTKVLACVWWKGPLSENCNFICSEHHWSSDFDFVRGFADLWPQTIGGI